MPRSWKATERSARSRLRITRSWATSRRPKSSAAGSGAHAETARRNRIWEAGKKAGMKAEKVAPGDDAVRTYIDGQIRGVGAPDSAVYKLLAGGKVRVKVLAAGSLPSI